MKKYLLSFVFLLGVNLFSGLAGPTDPPPAPTGEDDIAATVFVLSCGIVIVIPGDFPGPPAGDYWDRMEEKYCGGGN